MNPILMTNAQFYFALGVPLVGILVNVILFQTLNHRVDRLEDRYHSLDVRLEDKFHHLEDRLQTQLDLLVGKVGEVDVRLARLEERLAR